eukprot:m.99382 g.99382  ORF g.99382 m.99382 type:complete len:1408 (+) comp14904_c0_seq5:378-4601(+)
MAESRRNTGDAFGVLPERILDCCALVGVDLSKYQADPTDFPPAADSIELTATDVSVLHCFNGNPNASAYLKISALLANRQRALPDSEPATVSIPGYKDVLSSLPAFAFPCGANIHTAHPGEDNCTIFSFVSNWSGHYATCLRFYSPAMIEDQQIFVPAVLCFLSKTPCFSVLHDIAAFVAPFLADDTCSVGFLEEVVQIGSRIPQPLSGAICLRFFLQDHEFICRPSPQESLPFIDSPMAAYFQFFNPADLLRVVLAMAMDQSVIVFSSNIALLTPFCQALIGLMYPFGWHHTFIPLLPDMLSGWIQSPMPIFAGMSAHVQHEALSGLQESNTAVPLMLNLDDGRVSFPQSSQIPDCPQHIVDQFLASIAAVKRPYGLAVAGRAVVDPLHNKQAQLEFEAAKDLLIRESFLRCMVGLLKHVKTCINFATLPATLHADRFLASHPEDSRPFFEALISSTAFITFVRSRSKDHRDFFDVMCSTRVVKLASTTPLYFTLALDDTPNESPFESEGIHSASPIPTTRIVSPMLRTSSALRGNGTNAGLSSSLNRSQGFELSSPPLPQDDSVFLERSLSDSFDALQLTVPPSPLPSADSSKLFTPQTQQRTKTRTNSLPGTPLSRSFSQNSSFASYCQRMLVLLDRTLLGVEKRADQEHISASTEMGLLYLRAMYKLSLGQTLPAFQDLDRLLADGINFPSMRIATVIAELPEVDRIAIRESTLIKRSPIWEDIFKRVEAAKQAGIPARVFVENDTRTVSPLEDLRTLQGEIDILKFSQLATGCIGCSLEKAKQLFIALAAFYDGSTIPAAMCRSYFETLGGDARHVPLNIHQSLQLALGESILKCVAGVQAKEFGEIGLLILTHKRLFLARSDWACREIAVLANIRSVQLTTHRRKPWRQQAAIQLRDKENKEITLVFVSDRNKWYHFLREMQTANVFEEKRQGDGQIRLLSGWNVLFVDAIERTVTSSPGGRSLSKDDEIIERPEVVEIFSYPSLSENAQRLSRHRARGGIDLSPGTSDKRTIETIICVRTPEFGEQLWCGLGDGSIKLVDLPSLSVRHEFATAHTRRITALHQVKQTVWSAGFDAKASVLDVLTFRVLETLPMSTLQPIVNFISDSTGSIVWGCGIDGMLFGWSTSSTTRKLVHTINVNDVAGRRVSCFCLRTINDSLWIGCGDRILIIDENHEPQQTSDLLSPDVHRPSRSFRSRINSRLDMCKADLRQTFESLSEQDESEAEAAQDASSPSSNLNVPLRERSESVRHAEDVELPRTSSIVRFEDAPRRFRSMISTPASDGFTKGAGDEVWCFSGKQGVIEIRDAETLQRAAMGGTFTVSCGGFTSILMTQTCMWASANNGSIYVFDVHTHVCIMEYPAHADVVRCLCLLQEDEQSATVVSGSGSKDGTLSVWKQTARK